MGRRQQDARCLACACVVRRRGAAEMGRGVNMAGEQGEVMVSTVKGMVDVGQVRVRGMSAAAMAVRDGLEVVLRKQLFFN